MFSADERQSPIVQLLETMSGCACAGVQRMVGALVAKAQKEREDMRPTLDKLPIKELFTTGSSTTERTRTKLWELSTCPASKTLKADWVNYKTTLNSLESILLAMKECDVKTDIELRGICEEPEHKAIAIMVGDMLTVQGAVLLLSLLLLN